MGAGLVFTAFSDYLVAGVNAIFQGVFFMGIVSPILNLSDFKIFIKKVYF